MNRRLVLPLAALVLVLTGCGDDPEPVATALPGAPAMVRDRLPLPFCGQEEVFLDGSGIDEAARDCFVEAWGAGERAELISTFRTAEGDPVAQIFRSVGAGRIQLFRDTSEDRFGGYRGWLVRVCREYQPDPPGAARCGRPTLL